MQSKYHLQNGSALMGYGLGSCSVLYIDKNKTSQQASVKTFDRMQR